jgi:hypothetical protein
MSVSMEKAGLCSSRNGGLAAAVAAYSAEAVVKAGSAKGGSRRNLKINGWEVVVP